VIFIRHHEDCAGAPKPNGKLSGVCNCKVAPLDEDARKRLKKLLGKLAGDSIKSAEEMEYFALRLDMLADVILDDARGCRATAKRDEAKSKRRRSLAAAPARAGRS
jgi:hypothetical protein